MCQVPVKVTLERGMIDTGERGHETSHRAAGGLVQFRRTVMEVGEEDARKARHRPDEVFAAGCIGAARYGLAVRGADNTWSLYVPLGEDGEDMLLCLEQRTRFRCVRDLQDDPVAAFTDEEILIALAREWPRRTAASVQLARDPFGIGTAECR